MPDVQEWKPHKRQEDFLSIPPSIFEALFGGAAGPGKSEVLVVLPIVTGLFQLKRFKGLLMRRTFPELEKSLILRTQEIYPATGALYNKQLRRWTWPWGAILDFGYAEYEKDVRRYDTTEYTYIGFDELTSFTEFQYRYLSFTRCRTSDPSVPAFIRAATNPGNIGHGWVRERFVEPCREGYKRIVDRKSGSSRIFIPALPTDNPHLIKADPNYIKRLEMLPEAEKRAKLYGDWWTFEGQAFKFRNEKFTDEPDNALHVVPKFPLPESWPRVLAIDWGWSAMTYAAWGAITPNKRLIVYREYACNGKIADLPGNARKRVGEWAKDIIKLSQGENIVALDIDPSSKQDRGGKDKTIYEQAYNALGTDVGCNSVRLGLADNGRIGGKSLIHELLRWEPLPIEVIEKPVFDSEHADWLLRNRDFSVYKAYTDSFIEPEQEDNLPKIQIFDTLDLLIKTIPLCVIDETNPEDVAEFDGDDPYDTLRYLAKLYERITVRKTGKPSPVEELLAKAVEKKDYNEIAFLAAQKAAKEARPFQRVSGLSPLPIHRGPL